MARGAAKKDERLPHSVVTQWLGQHGYEHVAPNRFEAAKLLKQRIYTRELPLGKGIYKTDLACDFAVSNPDSTDGDLLIECHWQESSGTTDEKYPYFVKNIQDCYPAKARVVIVIGGGGYRPGALEWLKGQVSDRLKRVVTLDDFHSVMSKEGL